MATYATDTEPTIFLAGVNDETWLQRVDRLIRSPPAPRQFPEGTPDDQKRLLLVTDAQFQADKEMMNEIHLMLRHLVSRSLR